MTLPDRTSALYEAISASGFYPAVATSQVRRLVAGEPVRAELVVTDVTVDSDGLQMQAEVLAVTDTRLVFWGAYEEDGEDDGEDGATPVRLHSHSRAMPLRRLSDVRVMATVANPATFDVDDVPDAVRVVFVSDTLDRMQLEPLTCEDPDCGGGHGYQGEAVNDALVFAETKEAVGEKKLRELLDLAEVVAGLLPR